MEEIKIGDCFYFEGFGGIYRVSIIHTAHVTATCMSSTGTTPFDEGKPFYLTMYSIKHGGEYLGNIKKVCDHTEIFRLLQEGCDCEIT